MNEQIAALEREIYEKKQELSKLRRAAQPEEITSDYAFKTPDGEVVSLAGLFAGKDDLIVVHNMGEGCSYCTLWADGFNGFTAHLESRAAFVLCSPDAPGVLKEFAASRAWRFRTVTSDGDRTFARDMGYTRDDKFLPGVSAFHRSSDGAIARSGHAQLGPLDDFCAIWHLFDLLQGGPGDWQPRYSYD